MVISYRVRTVLGKEMHYWRRVCDNTDMTQAWDLLPKNFLSKYKGESKKNLKLFGTRQI